MSEPMHTTEMIREGERTALEALTEIAKGDSTGGGEPDRIEAARLLLVASGRIVAASS